MAHAGVGWEFFTGWHLGTVYYQQFITLAVSINTFSGGSVWACLMAEICAPLGDQILCVEFTVLACQKIYNLLWKKNWLEQYLRRKMQLKVSGTPLHFSLLRFSEPFGKKVSPAHHCWFGLAARLRTVREPHVWPQQPPTTPQLVVKRGLAKFLAMFKGPFEQSGSLCWVMSPE